MTIEEAVEIGDSTQNRNFEPSRLKRLVAENRSYREALREIANRLVYLYGRTDGTFDPPALLEIYGIAVGAVLAYNSVKPDAMTEHEPQTVDNSAAIRDALERECYDT